MARLFFEINGRPFTYKYLDSSKVSYITCYESEENIFEKKHFEEFNKAYEYYTEMGKKPELFIEITNSSTIRNKETLYINTVEYTISNEITFYENHSKYPRNKKCRIEYHEDFIKIFPYNIYTKEERKDTITLTRIFSYSSKPFKINDDYYELVPKFSNYDLVLELAFISSVIKKDYHFDVFKNLDALLIQKKKYLCQSLNLTNL